MDFQDSVWISRVKANSTAQATFIARRLKDMAEWQGKDVTPVCLDWPKTCDKLDQHRPVEVLQRLHAPPNILQTIGNMYQNAQFRVVKGENKSE